eukprot:7383164-Prymnesium_polylepis.1
MGRNRNRSRHGRSCVKRPRPQSASESVIRDGSQEGRSTLLRAGERGAWRAGAWRKTSATTCATPSGATHLARPCVKLGRNLVTGVAVERYYGSRYSI